MARQLGIPSVRELWQRITPIEWLELLADLELEAKEIEKVNRG